MIIQKIYKAFLITCSLVLLIASLALIITPSLRSTLINRFVDSNKREVLSSISLRLTNDSGLHKFIKVKQNKQILFEIYGDLPEQNKIATFNLGEHHDAELFFNEKSASLAAKDLDGDQIAELIVPTFKENLSPYIYVFKYNPTTLSFDKADSLTLIKNL